MSVPMSAPTSIRMLSTMRPVREGRVKPRRAPCSGQRYPRTRHPGTRQRRLRRVVARHDDHSRSLPSPPPLTALPALLAEEPALRAVIGRAPSSRCPMPPAPSSSPRSPAPSTRRPIVVAVPTGDRSRAARARPRAVPAAPTRSSTSRRGRRCPSSGCHRRSRRWAGASGCMWRLRTGRAAARPRRPGAGARAAPRPARRGRRAGRRAARRAHRPRRAASSGSSRWATGASTRSRRAARSRCAARSSTCTRSPTTTRLRIDLWGDEVDRLDRVRGRRPALDPRRRRGRAIFPRASCCPTDEVRDARRRAGARRAVGRGDVGAPRRRSDVRRHGVVAAVAHGRRAPAARPPARRRARARSCEPRRMRDRAQELLDEEAALATTLAVTWGATDRGARRAWPRLSLPFDRLLAHTSAGATNVLATPEGPDTPHLAATAFDPVVGDTDGARRRLRRLAGDGVPRRARGRRHRARRDRLARRARTTRASTRRSGAIAPGAIGIVVAPLDRGVVVPARRTRARRRGRPHRPASRAPTPARCASRHRPLRRARPPATTSCTTSRRRALRRDGAARDRRRRARLPAARVQGRRQALRADRPGRHGVRHYTGGETPTLHRMGGADFEKSKARVPRRGARDRAGARGALPPAPRHARATPFAPDTPWQHEIEEAFPYEETPDQAQAIDRGQGRHGAARSRWTASCAATSASARPRSRCAPRSRRCRTASRSRCSCRRRCSRASTARRSASASRTTRCGSRCCRGSSPTAEQDAVVQGLADGEVDVVIGTHRLLSDDIAFKDLGLLVDRRGAALRRAAQGADQEAADGRRRAHAVRDADPAHARALAHRHPRPVARQHAARGPPADPHLRRRVRRPGRGRGASAASCCARARCSSCTTG